MEWISIADTSEVTQSEGSALGDDELCQLRLSRSRVNYNGRNYRVSRLFKVKSVAVAATLLMLGSVAIGYRGRLAPRLLHRRDIGN